MPIDTVRMMELNAGELSETEIVELVGELLSSEGLENLDSRFSKLAHRYIKKGYLDEEGDINYIKLKGDL